MRFTGSLQQFLLELTMKEKYEPRAETHQSQDCLLPVEIVDLRVRSSFGRFSMLKMQIRNTM